jgi:hypothetical protein
MANHLGSESGASAVAAVAKGHALFPALDKNQRLSERVFLNLPVRLSSAGGADFLEEAQTVDISRHGAAVMVEGELSIGQAVKIQRVGAGKEAMARVVGRIPGGSGGESVRAGFARSRSKSVGHFLSLSG